MPERGPAPEATPIPAARADEKPAAAPVTASSKAPDAHPRDSITQAEPSLTPAKLGIFRREVIRLATDHPLLLQCLDTQCSWDLDSRGVVLRFENHFALNVAKDSLPFLQKAAYEVLQEKVDWHLDYRGAAGKMEDLSPEEQKAERIRAFFQGEIVKRSPT